MILRENARMEKWSEMLANFEDNMKNNFDTLKSRARKGIPDCFRGVVWQRVAQISKYKNEPKFRELYLKCREEETVDKSIESVILRDIDRTFPKNAFFKDKYGLGQRTLYAVLRAYSKFNKEVGYVQGMGFITAVFLTYMDEESSFWLLHSMMDNPKFNLKGLYTPNFPDLRVTFYKFMSLLKKHLNKVYEHLVRKFLTY